MRTLEKTHPLNCFLYLLSVMGVTIFTRHPLLIAETLIGALLLLVLCGKGKMTLWALPVILVCAVTNPLFSHNGDTALFFIGNAAYTLEALIFGGIFGGMLAAACAWSIASVRFITSDKYIWLFGRVLPVSGLVLSCSMRMIPLFIRRTKSFAAADSSDSLRSGASAFSASLGYSAEQAMTSADSMKARGYGTAKRTSYSLYRFGRRELMQLTAVLVTSILTLTFMILGNGSFECYPRVQTISSSAADIILYIAFGTLCLLPSFAVIFEHSRRMSGYSTIKEH